MPSHNVAPAKEMEEEAEKLKKLTDSVDAGDEGPNRNLYLLATFSARQMIMPSVNSGSEHLDSLVN